MDGLVGYQSDGDVETNIKRVKMDENEKLSNSKDSPLRVAQNRSLSPASSHGDKDSHKLPAINSLPGKQADCDASPRSSGSSHLSPSSSPRTAALSPSVETADQDGSGQPKESSPTEQSPRHSSSRSRSRSGSRSRSRSRRRHKGSRSRRHRHRRHRSGSKRRSGSRGKSSSRDRSSRHHRSGRHGDSSRRRDRHSRSDRDEGRSGHRSKGSRRSSSRDRHRRSSSRDRHHRSRSRDRDHYRGKGHHKRDYRGDSPHNRRDKRYHRSRSRDRPAPYRRRGPPPRGQETLLKPSYMRAGPNAEKDVGPVDFKTKMKQELQRAAKEALALQEGTSGGPKMDTQQALLHTMAAMHAKAQELTGVQVPKYYNPAAVNPLKYAEQQQKRKLLWSKATDNHENKVQQWQGTTVAADEKIRKLMGMKEEDVKVGEASSAMQQKQTELFAKLDQEYAMARLTAHTHRGMGLGVVSLQSFQAPPAAPPESKGGEGAPGSNSHQ